MQHRLSINELLTVWHTDVMCSTAGRVEEL